MTQEEQDREFNRRSNLPHVEVRRMYGRRYKIVSLSYCGIDLGARHDDVKRGKVISSTYILPPMPKALTP